MKFLLQISLLGMAILLTSCQTTEEMPNGVYFKNIKYGAVVSSPFTVQMGVHGMDVQPAGKIIAGTGHHHIIINSGSLPSGNVVPADDEHIHFGKGQTETVLSLDPGKYTLTLQFANGFHQSYGAKYSKSIDITVK